VGSTKENSSACMVVGWWFNLFPTIYFRINPYSPNENPRKNDIEKNNPRPWVSPS
jgi:hypothetical protein